MILKTNKKLRSFRNHTVAFIATVLCVAGLFTVSTIYAQGPVKVDQDYSLTLAKVIEVPETVAKFNQDAAASSLKEKVVENIATQLTYTREDYVPLKDSGMITCGENEEFTLEYGCVCSAGYYDDGENGCQLDVGEYLQTELKYDGSGWASVTTDASAYYGDNAVVNAALSLVGSYGYYCNEVVNYALSAIGWTGSYFSGEEVGLDGMVPGDVIVYPGHYAIYVGDGMAVHGGYNGLNVILGEVVVGKVPYTAYHCQ